MSAYHICPQKSKSTNSELSQEVYVTKLVSVRASQVSERAHSKRGDFH